GSLRLKEQPGCQNSWRPNHWTSFLPKLMKPASTASSGPSGPLTSSRWASALYAGPAIVLSFIIAGIGCVFAGLCYAEFASLIPIAGSAYTYGYSTLGEIFAWIIGWALILEY